VGQKLFPATRDFLRLLHFGLPSVRVHYPSVGRRFGEPDAFLESRPAANGASIPSRDSHTSATNNRLLKTIGKRYLWLGGCFVFSAQTGFWLDNRRHYRYLNHRLEVSS
jgi:hypothetical protein